MRNTYFCMGFGLENPFIVMIQGHLQGRKGNSKVESVP